MQSAHLNHEQKQAVHTCKGRVLVLAGAGTGKTRVIVHRIAHLIRNLNVNPSAILGMTFTNKAAAEMRERVQELIGSAAAQQITLSTFHSFCMQVLRKEIYRLGYTSNFSLYDEGDLRRLIGQMAHELLNHEGELPSLQTTIAAITSASQQGSKVSSEFQWNNEFSKNIFERMQNSLRAYNAVSFDSLITLTIQLFEEHPKVLEAYQDRYHYIMIDEYQDTNPAQMRLSELLAGRTHNLCVVGDDDQSIYGWRGSEIKHILEFAADTTISLEQNYRSTPNILAAANAVIQNNHNRHKKILRSIQTESEPVEIFHAQTDIEEAQSVINRILHLRETKNMAWSDMAILYRSNALSRTFETQLLQTSWNDHGHWVRGIPYEIYGGLSFSERSEIKDLLAYLRIIANPKDGEALLRIINVPRRGISDTFLDQLTQHNRSKNVSLWEVLEQVSVGNFSEIGTARAQNSVSSFVHLIDKYRAQFSQNSLAETLSKLVEEIHYKKAIEDDVKSEHMRLFKWENVQECINALAQYEQEQQERKMNATLQDFISNTTLVQQSISPNKRSKEKLQLMTLHSAKGLEFPACFIVGLEDHILPHEKSVEQTGIEEERRLFYVGITRARKHLTLSMARSRMKNGKYVPTAPSRFLFEIPKKLLRMTTPQSFK